MVLLAGDIGGTKSHLVLFQKGCKRSWTKEKKFRSADYTDFLSLLLDFLAGLTDELEGICLGVAGAVWNNRCTATNLPWVIDGAEIAEKLGVKKVVLINDLLANMFGVSQLRPEEFFVLHPGVESPGTQVLISAGTGLGEAALVWYEGKYAPCPTEGGHATFAPENLLEIAFLKFLQQQYDHVSFERSLSGRGLVLWYQFFIESGLEQELPEVREAMQRNDPAKVVSEYGMRRACPACARALFSFVEVYGSEASNLALKFLAMGGVFIGGGIAPKILNAMKEGGFMKRFIKKGRFTSLLLQIPVKIILNEQTALIGAANYAETHI